MGVVRRLLAILEGFGRTRRWWRGHGAMPRLASTRSRGCGMPAADGTRMTGGAEPPRRVSPGVDPAHGARAPRSAGAVAHPLSPAAGACGDGRSQAVRGRPRALVPVAAALASLLAFALALGGAWRTPPGEAALAGTPAKSGEHGAAAAGEGSAGAAGEGKDAGAGGAPTPAEGRRAQQGASMPAPAGVFDEAQVVRELRAFREALVRRARLVEADRAAALALLERVGQRIDELDARIQRLEALRGELQRLVGELDRQERERLQRLVRIYEGMKPKKAAAIFDRLEMDTLLPIAARMRPNRLALVLQAMNPERARELTRRLAEVPERPDLSALGGAAGTATAGSPPAAAPSPGSKGG